MLKRSSITNLSSTLSDEAFAELKAALEAHLPQVQTPALVFDVPTLQHHAQLLKHISERSGCKVLFAVKAFANHRLFKHIQPYVAGTCVTSLNELELVKRHFPGEIHAYRPAFTPTNMGEYVSSVDHMVCNSFSQYQRLKPEIQKAESEQKRKLSVGLRINPEVSAISDENLQALYNPCSAGSRLGITKEIFDSCYDAGDFEGIEGLHIHALCGSSAEDLLTIIQQIEANYAHVLSRDDVKWLNFGGGHAFSKLDYNIDLLCSELKRLADTYKVQLYIEPGEFVVTDVGYYVTTVDDIVDTPEGKIGIIDGSADAHMHDSVHMPFRYEVFGAVDPDADDYNASTHPYVYRFGGNTCMTGDMVHGRFAFSTPLKAGQKLIFNSFAEYTTVLFSTFNGVPWPNYYQLDENRAFSLLRKSKPEDYLDRL